MKKFSILLFLAAAIQISRADAQAQPIRGRVIDDSTGAGLPAATILIQGTTRGTASGPDGGFTIAFPADGKRHTLQISLTGYSTVTVPATNSSPIEVRLKRESKELEDVVVIGYQSVRKRDLLASVSTVTSRDLKDIPLNSAEESLAGRLAGVQVTGSEGSPNAQVLIRVRGGGSITQDNSPLYVVDGIQVDNGLSTISIQDIESINVLKDAASTSIYGARGANGVVIITTKGGRNTSGKTNISYNGFAGINKLEKELPLLSPYDYIYYQFERGKQTGDTSGIAPYGNATDWSTVQNYKNTPAYDWQHKMFGRSAFQQTHNVGMSGGTEQTQYNLSLSDARQDGVMLNSDYARELVNFRFDHKATDRVRVGFNVRYNNTIIDGAGTSSTGSSALNFLRQVVRYRPFLVPGQSDNSFDPNYYAETNANSLALVNPVLLNNAQYRKSFNNIVDLNAYLNYTVCRAVSFKSTIGYDYNAYRLDAFDDTLTYNSKINGASMPIADVNSTSKATLDNNNVFTLSNQTMGGRFKERNNITAIIGEETYQTHEKDYYVETRFYPLGTTASAALGNLNLGTPPNSTLSEPKPTAVDYTTTLLSFFGRITYDFDKKYLAYVSFRADGSSLFAPSNRWGYFPAGTVAWRMSQEKFLQDVSWISDLKMRVSYGAAGNNRISPYLYVTQFNTNSQYGLNDQLITGYAPAGLANPNLKWETTVSRNLGFDASLFRDRFGFTIDIYSNTTNNLLVNTPIPTSSGYTTQLQNVGSTSNKGVELQLSSTIMQKRSFGWTASFNISFNQNKVVNLGLQKSYLQSSNWAGSANPADYIVQVGKPVGSMYGLVTDGYYTTNDFNYNSATRVYTLKPGVPNDAAITATTPMPGSIKFKDLNGDSVITNADRTIIGYAQPKFFGGLTQQFTYKGFDCSIFINFQYGNKVFNDNKLEFSSGYTPGANLLGIMKDRWHTVDGNGVAYESLVSGQVVGASPDSLNALNKGAKVWIPLVGSSSTTFQPQSWAVEDASFIRINNITVGYSLPAGLVHKLKITRLRLYATVNNVAVITGYSGYDPEVNTRRDTPVTPGVDYSAYPRSRSFLAGINLTF
ncbi:MAG: TonB-dependent receptor [Bacteroidota bacterium]|nr:TonB-dependent receptor [Bacteroidota bacterium]